MTKTFLLQKYNYNPKHCLFFGDAVADFKASGNCGVCFPGIIPVADAPLLQAIPGISWGSDFSQPALLESLQLS